MRHELEVQGFIVPSNGAALFPSVTPLDSQVALPQEQAPAHLGISEPDALDNVLSIHEYERQQLAQELHDSAGQLVIALELSLAHLKRVEKDRGNDSLLEEIQDTVRRIDQEIRSMSFMRYPAELCDRSLCSALQSLALGFGRRTGIRVNFKWIGDQSAVSVSISKAVLRITQEALTNVHRHSRATAVRVAVDRQSEQLHLTISDNGVGFPSATTLEKARGIGLQGMRHRIEALGGRFRIGSLKHGAKISVIAPVPTAG